jgi:hypothetical protein
MLEGPGELARIGQGALLPGGNLLFRGTYCKERPHGLEDIVAWWLLEVDRSGQIRWSRSSDAGPVDSIEGIPLPFRKCNKWEDEFVMAAQKDALNGAGDVYSYWNDMDGGGTRLSRIAVDGATVWSSSVPRHIKALSSDGKGGIFMSGRQGHSLAVWKLRDCW